MELRKTISIVVIAILSFIFIAACDSGPNTVVLEDTITTEALVAHTEALETISLGDALSRYSNSPAYVEAMDYIKSALGNSGFTVWEEQFDHRFFSETGAPVLSMISPSQEDYVWKTDYKTLTYSGVGDVTADVAFVAPVIPPGAELNTSTDGCEATDFQGIDVTGKIAVIQRGGCDFIDKATNAESQGAVAVLVFNEGQEGRTEVVSGTLSADSTVTIPVLGIQYSLGKTLYDQYSVGTTITLRIAVTATDTTAPTYNLFAETVAGRSDQVILVGAHLDSVVDGPGANDNASGVAAILEVARQMALNGYTPQNRIRFAWWGAEEVGSIGSNYYLDNLSDSDLQSIVMYLNFDSIASHNFIRGVDDGDLSATIDDPENIYQTTPEGSGAIEQVFLDYFQAQGLPTKPVALDGRSDYDNFADHGIPFGGLETGLDEIKTDAEALLFGGTAGEAYDSCYHTACDTVDYMNTQVFTENARAIAYAVQYFGDSITIP